MSGTISSTYRLLSAVELGPSALPDMDPVAPAHQQASKGTRSTATGGSQLQPRRSSLDKLLDSSWVRKYYNTVVKRGRESLSRSQTITRRFDKKRTKHNASRFDGRAF